MFDIYSNYTVKVLRRSIRVAGFTPVFPDTKTPPSHFDIQTQYDRVREVQITNGALES